MSPAQDSETSEGRLKHETPTGDLHGPEDVVSIGNGNSQSHDADAEVTPKPNAEPDSHLNNNYKMFGTGVKKTEANGKPALLTLPQSTEVAAVQPGKDSNSDGEDGINHQKKGRKKFFVEVKADLMNKDLLPLKILFFFKYATLYVLYPYLPLHLKQLGLTATEAGISSGIIPIFVIMAPAFSGVIADKIGNFKIFLSCLTFINAPLALSLLLVPTAREIVTLPGMLTLTFSCNHVPSSAINFPFVLNTVDPSLCQIDPANGVLDLTSLSSTTLQCGTVCTDPEVAATLPVYGLDANKTDSYRLVDETLVFTPAPNKTILLICTPKSDCRIVVNSDPDQSGTPLVVDTLQLLDVPPGNVTKPKFGIGLKGFELGNKKFVGNETATCHPYEQKPTTPNCRTECIAQIKRSLICSNKQEQKVYNVGLTFGLYTFIRIFLGVISATSFIMFEGAVLAILKEFGGDYGLQRVAATLAAIFFAPLSGTLIQIFDDFYPAFYLYAVLQLISGLITLTIDLRFKRPTDRIIGRLKEVLTQVEILIFFAAMLLTGTSWGYLESFLFWFLEDLKASNVLMGLTISIGGLFGIPILILSRPIIKKFGHVNILCVGLFFYAVRLFGYSFIQNPWLCLPFEAMESITASLAITSAATYAASLSNSQTIASIQGIWGGLYFGFGRGAGSLAGGYLMRWVGSRNTFRIFSAVSLAGCILYFIINLTYIDKHKHLRKTSGLNMHDLQGDRQKRLAALEEERQANGVSKVDGGYIGPCEVSFTDIPLDEETPKLTNKSKTNQPTSNVTNRKSDKE